MKHLLALLGCVTALGTPLCLPAAPAPSVDGERSARWLEHTEVIGRGKSRAVYYYTNVVLTGSHIPVVIRRFRGKLEIVAGSSINGVAYAIGDFGGGSGNDVASTLSHLDPSISAR